MPLTLTEEPALLEEPRPAPHETMPAAVLCGPWAIVIREVAVPRPGPDEVRIRVEGCGVCASNLEPWEGMPWTEYPFAPGAPGHEGWGRVDAVGDRVRNLRKGDRVAFLGARSYAQYDLAPAHSVALLPRALADLPFAGEAFACAVNVFARSRIRPGDDVAVVGAGFLGLLLTRLASRAGAHVIAISRRAYALAQARRMGAEATVALDDPAAVAREVRALTHGTGCVRVIEAAGRQATLDLAAELTAERGTLVVAGYHQDGPRLVNMQLWNWRGIDVVNAHERDPRVRMAGMAEAIRLAADGTFDAAALLTHRLPLSALSEALRLTRERPDGFLKAWVRP